jgi:ATP-dependent helicase/nuclease subunit A
MNTPNWTTEQKAAIETIHGDLLVTAAAGAGKTAVLTQRCIYLVTQVKPPCSLDEILVLTFTEAAAAEMRRRIRAVLYEQGLAAPRNVHLRRQIALLDQARISTIHSFCNTLLREYFYRLNLDPGFEVLDAAEADLVKLQIADDLFEDYYARSQEEDLSDDFADFVRSYSSGAGDRLLINILIRLHNFLETLSDRSDWSEHARRILKTADEPDPQNLFVVQRQKELLKLQLDNLIRRLDYAKTEISRDSQLHLYLQYLDQDVFPLVREIRNALAADNLNQALKILSENENLKRIPNKPRDLAPEQVEPAKNLIGQAKEVYKTLNRKFALPVESVVRQLHSVAPSIHLLLDLQQNFLQRYNDAKRRQNVLDFADLEHLTLTLLQENGRPSEVALQVRERYRFILVDEYQDISPIQEALLQTISRRRSSESPDQKDGPNLGNLFMVGDVKQSIYSFRQADPSIFLAKMNHFIPYDRQTEKSSSQSSRQIRIDLNRNFRSRRHLIWGINYIFSRCMIPEFAGFDYQREAQLSYGADFYDQLNPQSESESASAIEIHLIERELDASKDDDQKTEDAENDNDRFELDAARREAVIVARRIRQIVGVDRPDGKPEFDIVDPDTKQLRPVTWRDIVILLRSMKMHAEIWSEVFHQMSVPVHAELTGGFFVATEIQDMLSLLQLLENPQQDIPLASVLRSPFVRLDESQLAAIRLHSPRQPYHQAVFRFADSGPDETIRQMLSTFLERLDGWRTLARREPLAQLIWQIYRDTNLLAYISGLPEGQQRYRNLLHLHDRARQFDTFANQGLARFLDFIEKLREEEGDFGPAPVLTQADNVVRIMSVHKSKGLEFPVVILADLARKFNKADLKSDIIYSHSPHSPYDTNTSSNVDKKTLYNIPIGIRVSHPDTAVRYPTLTHRLVAAEKDQSLLNEELRILYVALTRARERLLLIAGCRLAKCRDNWHLGQKCGTKPNSDPAFDCAETGVMGKNRSIIPLPEFVLSAAKSPIDWLGPALAEHPDMQVFLGEEEAGSDPAESRFRVVAYEAEEVGRLVGAVKLGRDSRSDRELPRHEDSVPLGDEAQAVIERLQWRYPQAALTQLGARTSVTELKRQMNPDYDPDFAPSGKPQTEPYQQKPKFMRDQPARTGAVEIGSWTHLFLQHVDLEKKLDLAGLDTQLDELVGRGVFSEEQRQGIDVSEIERFFASELGQVLLGHRASVMREWPFTLALPVGEVYPKIELNEQEKEETVLIRGIIDCWFETKEGIWIIDFKTDNISDADCSQRAESYRVQMQLYRRAVEEILQTKVAASVLYFLKPGVAVEIS